jgi:hypothetical protein
MQWNQRGSVMPGLWRCLVLGHLLAIIVYSGVSAQGTSRVFGTVLDERSKALADVRVLLGDRFAALTDANGRFGFSNVPAGDYELSTERLGFIATANRIALRGDTSVDVVIHMSARPIALPPIAVIALSGKLVDVGFYERQRQSGLSGRYITRADLERRHPTQFTDAMHDVQGVKVIQMDLGKATLRFNRQVPEQGVPGRPNYAFSQRRSPIDARGCEPDLYIDGRRYRNASAPPGSGADFNSGIALNKVDDFNAVPVNAIEGIEVYVGANVPVFVANTACGVVLIWTRR